MPGVSRPILLNGLVSIRIASPKIFLQHLYGTTGINTGNTYYYHLGGRIIGELTGITTLTTQFFLTDALGSVLATFSAIAGSAAVLGNQIYGPYGNQRYSKGPMGTAKGYTGQYADATGLDYYNARYYDPVVGLFVSADNVQGNAQGMDPYAYVGENPETMVDPSGKMRICSDIASGCSGMSGGGSSTPTSGCGPCHDPNKPWPRPGSGSSTGSSGGTTMRPTPTATPPTPTATPPAHSNGGGGSNSTYKNPTHGQINNARSAAGSAASYFSGLAGGATLLAGVLFSVSRSLIQLGGQILLASEGPWAFLTVSLGLSLLALGALASVLAWQETRQAAMLGVLSLMYVGENRMPDSWWTPAAIQGFATSARLATTAVSVTVAALSFFTKLPGTIPASLLSQAGTEGALGMGRSLGVSIGMLSGAAIDNQVDYYTRLETTCLTQSSCSTS